MMTQPSTQCDNELLRRMVAGDEQAFVDLYRRHQGALYRFALLMSGSATVAEDVTQEAFLFLLREPDRYDPARGKLSAFLYGVARNHILRHLEKGLSFVPLMEDDSELDLLPPLIAESDPFRECTRNQMIHLVRQAVLTLPSLYREVVILCDFQELSYADAAAALGCAVGTVSSRLYRGHALLMKRLRALRKADPAMPDVDLLRCFL